MFEISNEKLNPSQLGEKLLNKSSGALVTFEGWVRDHNQGHSVSSLEYQIYEVLALKEGQKIINEAIDKFNIHDAYAIHRAGHLKIGDIAVWIGAIATHRDDAFKATRFIIDEIKYRLPVWKKEHYMTKEPKWVFCKDHHHHVHFHEEDYFEKQKSLFQRQKLTDKKVLVIGAGGLGVPALLAITTSGIGYIHIVDHDKIEISNIHRQVIYHPGLVGESKALQAASYLAQLNPFVKITAEKIYVDESNISELIRPYDLILDCTDNMKTKFLVQDACMLEKLPFVTASIYKYEAQLRTIDNKNGCLRCLQKDVPSDSKLGNCNDFGVLGATVNTIGSLQASEAIKYLLEGKNNTIDHTLYLNLSNLTQLKIKNLVDSKCKYCSGDIKFCRDPLEISRSDISNDESDLIDIRDLSDEEVLGREYFSNQSILFCHRGIRSKRLAEILHAQGKLNVYSLKGGACSL